MGWRLDPGLKAARDRELELDERSAATPFLTRFAALPVMVVCLVLAWAQLIWAAIWVLAASLMLALIVAVTGIRRDLLVHRVTVGAYKRSRRSGLPPQATPKMFEPDPRLTCWGGLPPSAPAVRSGIGLSGALCWVTAVTLGLNAQVPPVTVVVIEAALALAALCAVVVWWWRCNRAVWVYASRWPRVWIGHPSRTRTIGVAAGLGLTILLVVWASTLLAGTGSPWRGSSSVPTASGVRADAVGNLGVLGFVFMIAFMNSLGGLRNAAVGLTVSRSGEG